MAYLPSDLEQSGRDILTLKPGPPLWWRSGGAARDINAGADRMLCDWWQLFGIVDKLEGMRLLPEANRSSSYCWTGQQPRRGDRRAMKRNYHPLRERVNVFT